MLQDVFFLQVNVEAFATVPYEVKIKLFPFLAANVTTLDCLLGLLSAPNTAAAITIYAQQLHCEMLEEVRHANTDQANILLQQTAR